MGVRIGEARRVRIVRGVSMERDGLWGGRHSERDLLFVLWDDDLVGFE